MEASYGDYIIKGINGEIYPCKPDIFEKTYEQPKQYLKWEDLEFKEEEQWLKVKMGDRNYTLIYWKFTLLGKEYYTSELRNEETLDIIQHIRGKLFNDLHLERVEE